MKPKTKKLICEYCKKALLKRGKGRAVIYLYFTKEDSDRCREIRNERGIWKVKGLI